jgi:hypothetical protein
VTEDKSFGALELSQPTQCVLWEHPERLSSKFSEFFEEVETYEDKSHLSRVLYKCRECGQLYFFEWYEWVDWDEGNDKQYSSLIPVRTREEAETLNNTDTFNLMRYFPRLHLDGTTPVWNGKGECCGGYGAGGACREREI